MTSCCMNFAIIIQWIYFTIWEKIKKNRHHYNTILSFYNIMTLQEEFAKKSNIPWIWRIIYGHKLPYMKKTRKKKQVCGAACFMAAEIKFSKDVRLSIHPSTCPSGRLSGRLSRLPCPLCNIYSSGWILSILAINNNYHERVCRTQWPLTLTYIFKVIRPWLRKSCPLCSV